MSDALMGLSERLAPERAPHRQDPFRFEARMVRLQILEALDHEPGAGYQHARDHDLRDDEHVAEALGASSRGPPAEPKRIVQVGCRRLPSRHHAKQSSGQNSQCQGKHQHTTIERHLVQKRYRRTGGDEPEKRSQPEGREKKS